MFNYDKQQPESLWEFKTARFAVLFWAEEEDSAPQDHFTNKRDIKFAHQGGAHWFCAFVGVFNLDTGDCVAWDCLGGCSYGSFREFYSSHRWQYSRNQKKWITDNKSPAWKACEAKRPRDANGRRQDGGYFNDMVHEAITSARAKLGLR